MTKDVIVNYKIILSFFLSVMNYLFELQGICTYKIIFNIVSHQLTYIDSKQNIYEVLTFKHERIRFQVYILLSFIENLHSPLYLPFHPPHFHPTWI